MSAAAAEMVIAVTFFPDYRAVTKCEEALHLSDLASRIAATTAPTKAALPLLKLARFGDHRTDNNSLRHNANVLAFTGLEADYDGERLSFDEACEIPRKAGVAAVVYTSPSHTEDAPRWRVLCLLSAEYSAASRDAFLARLNGLFGGIFATESWTLSQSFYYGSVNQSPSHRVELIDGTPIDLMDELDAGAIGKPGAKAGNGNGAERPIGSRRPYPPVSGARLEGYRASVLDNLRRQAVDGQKHNALRSAALVLGGVQAAAGFTDADAIQWLLDVLPPSVEDWAHAARTAAWGLEQGRARPIELEDRPHSSGNEQGSAGEQPHDDPSPCDRAQPLDFFADTVSGDHQAAAGEEQPDEDPSKPGSRSEAEDTEAPWQKYLQTDYRGQVMANLANAALAIRQAPELVGLVAYDEMLRHTLVTRSPPGSRMAAVSKPRPLQDTDVAAIQEWLQRHKLRRLGRDVTQQACDLVAREHAFHPVRDYLTGLTWDGTPRLDTWLSRYLGAAATPYTAAIGRCFPISMVARIMRPGCKCDYMPVLEDEQGAGKSTACAILAGDWYSDNLPELHRGDQVRISMHLRGKWLLEVPEMSAISKAEAEALKAFLTQKEERYTPKYARNEVIEPRQCVFVGTTNKTVYLRDETGGRRTWPIKIGVTGIIDTDALARDRDQLFAEAVVAFASGEKWWPDRAFEAEHIKPEQEGRFEADAWEAVIGTWLETPIVDETRPSGLGPRTSCTVAEVAGAALDLETARLGTLEQRRIAAALERLGWRRGTRTTHSRPWVRQ